MKGVDAAGSSRFATLDRCIEDDNCGPFTESARQMHDNARERQETSNAG
jgi:hypothetical protein